MRIMVWVWRVAFVALAVFAAATVIGGSTKLGCNSKVSILTKAALVAIEKIDNDGDSLGARDELAEALKQTR